MDEHKISRRALLAAAAGAVGTAALPPSNAHEAESPRNQSGNGSAITPDIYASLFGVFNVRTYGAKGDGVSDEAPAILAAIAAVPRQGGIVYFPPGVYLLNSSITVNARTNLSLLGAGVSATRLQMNANGVIVLSFAGVCSHITIRDLWLGAMASFASGGSLSIIGTSDVHSDTFVIENVRLQNTPAPWFSQYLDNSQIRNVRVMQTIAGAVKSVGMLMNNCVSTTFTEVVMLSTAGQYASEGVRVDYDCDTIIFINSQVLHAETVGWRCAQTSGHTGPRLCRFTNCYAESCTGSGWLIQAARDVRLSACHAAVNGGNGFEITGGDSITVSDSLALSNGQHGIVITGGTGVLLNGNTCSNNSQEATATYSGISVGNNVTGVRVVNNRSGDFVITLPKKQKHGIAVSSVGTDSLVVTGNDLRGNATGALDDSSPGTTKLITRNIGVATVGVSPVIVTSSPFTYTNKDGVPEVIYITGGAVSAVAKNGVTIFGAGPCTIYLDPGEAATVTYSIAPAMNKDRK
ncbi:MAG: hypothetical protein E6L09_13950 [Verrucomicrobia bacterium]|nr:MAG: hypothetical protein E6L09_13950 [Verrucomicrobiota bacterium]